MSDDLSTTAPEPITVEPEKQTTRTLDELTRAPAMHSDTLWGGARYIENATEDPVFVETKQQYWDLLNKTGWTMKHQQESTTGPQRDPILPRPAPVRRAPAPLSAEEAELVVGMDAFNRRYRLLETLWCNVCFTDGRPSGCRVITKPHHIEITCRCGHRIYQPPMGTTDLPTAASATLTSLDETSGTLVMAHETGTRPTTLIQAHDAKLIRAYVRMLSRRELEPRWFCPDCFDGRVTEDRAMAVLITDEQIVMVCPKHRMRFYQGS